MSETNTEYGTVTILNLEDIFERMMQAIERICREKEGEVTVGLTGGSTPKAFYQWATEGRVFNTEVLDRIIWMTSDERYVPWESEESNFGNADRLMLEPLGVMEENKRPWAVGRKPEEAARQYNNYFKEESCFDLCILGMGDDCHTASLFPGSLLISEENQDSFSAIDVPSKGMRLTITPKGLSRCGEILMVVTGLNKTVALKQVLEGPYNLLERPAQLHKDWAEKVTWLVDNAAASQLSL